MSAVRIAVGVGLGLAVLVFGPASARAWEPFRTANRNVEDGNERLAANDAAGALQAYDRAARELPSEPGVHLDRGLALLAQGQHDRAREAFLLATEPPAPPAIRADAYYDLGLAFYQQADAKAAADDHPEAQRLFREAADGFRRSLRARPGNRDAAWNLELALRRIREEQEEQRQQEEQQRAQNEQNQQQQQNQQNQQDPQNQQQQQDPQDPGQQGQDGQQDPQQQQAQNDPQQGQDGSDPQQQQQGQDGQPQQQDGQQGQQQQQADAQDGQGAQPGQDGTGAQQAQQADAQDGNPGGLPAEAARVLDALQDGEDNLERYRAHARAARENRRPTKDW